MKVIDGGRFLLIYDDELPDLLKAHNCNTFGELKEVFWLKFGIRLRI